MAALRPGPDEALSIAGTWKHRFGDDHAWARPDFDDSAWSDLQVPMGWGQRGGPEVPFAWFRRTVVPGPGSAAEPGGLALSLGKVDSAYEIFAGGARLGGVGGLPPTPRIEYDRHRTYVVPPSAVDPSGRVVLAIRVWNAPETNARVPSLAEGPFLMGPIAALTRREMLSELPELILASVFFVTGLYHLQLHRRRPELREYLWFGLVAVGAAAYTFLRTQWKYVLFDDFLVLKEVEHALLFVMAPLYVAFLFPFLSWPIHPLLRGYQALNVAAAAASLAAPGLWLNLRILTVWEYAAFLFTPYTLSVVARAWWRGHPEGRTIGFGALALSVCYLNDTALDLGWIVTRRLIPFGFAAFVFSMAVSLANRFTRVHGEIEVLRRDLERRVLERTAELSHANLELQARTRELAEASHAKSQFLANVSHDAPLAHAPRRGRVLIAEDNMVNQKVTMRMLERLGFEADAAATGQEAVAAVCRGRYDAILMDSQMPGMDGFQATSRIRAFEGPVRHTPIIALTAGATRGNRERCLAAGMDDFVAKPMSPEQLEAVLQRWVPTPGQPSEARDAAAPAATVEGPIDWVMVSDLLAVTPPDFLADMLVLFSRDAARALTDLRIAWREDDLATWAQIAHKLGGSCAILGARAMREICAEMEDLDQAAMMQDGERMLDALEVEFVRARDLLAERQRKAAVAPLGGNEDTGAHR